MSPYFSAPSETLDPCLFNGDKLKPEERAALAKQNGFPHR
jgi:hypothetical protein